MDLAIKRGITITVANAGYTGSQQVLRKTYGMAGMQRNLDSDTTPKGKSCQKPKEETQRAKVAKEKKAAKKQKKACQGAVNAAAAPTEGGASPSGSLKHAANGSSYAAAATPTDLVSGAASTYLRNLAHG